MSHQSRWSGTHNNVTRAADDPRVGGGLIIAKHRNGPTTTVAVAHQAALLAPVLIGPGFQGLHEHPGWSGGWR